MAAIASAALPTETAAQASAPAIYRIDISARTLRRAIAELARESGVSIGTEGSLPALRTPVVSGQMTVGDALARLLAGSGYRARQVGPTAWRIERLPPPSTIANVATTPARSMPAAPPATPIVVTAAKANRDIQGLPLAVSRFALSDAAPRHLPEAGSYLVAKQVEGMALAGSGAGRNRMFLRGVADSPFSGESQSTVAIMVDGARITYAAPDPDIRLVDVDRVEVLKGPQGTLYGAGALGGIYQIVTNRPAIDHTSLALSGGLNAVAKGDLGYGGSAVVNLPLARDRAALRVVGYGMREAGWVDTGARPDSNAQHILGLRGALGIEPAGDWRIDLSGLAQRIDVADSQYVYAEGARSRPAQLAEPHDNDVTLASASAFGPVGALRLQLDTSYVWHEVRDTFDATQGAQGFGVVDPQLLHDDREYRIWNAETRLDGPLGRLDWQLGIARIEARQTVLSVIESATDPEAATIDDDRRTSTESALFANLRLPLGAQFGVEAGARLFRGTVRDTRIVNGQPVSRDLHRTGLTPSVALSWRPSASRTVFLRYGSALRQGGAEIDSTGALESFDSDELETLEAGWRERLPGGGSIELGAFATRWKDVQSDTLQSDRLIETINAGTARILGLEASWEQDLGTFWHAAAGATITDGKLVHDETGLQLEDRRLPVVPTYTLRGALRRDIALGNVHSSIGFSVHYTGPARLSFDPLLDREMGHVLDGRLEAHATLGEIEAMLAIDNLFACSADTFAYGNRLRIFDTDQFTPLRPTSVTLSLGWHF